MTNEQMRIAHNFLFKQKDNDYHPEDLEVLQKYVEFSKEQNLEQKKIAVLLVCVNQNYWQFAGQTVEDLQKYFLPGHQTDIFLWSDMPKWSDKEIQDRIEKILELEQKVIKSQAEERIPIFFELINCYLEALYLGKFTDGSQVIQGLRRIGLDCEFQPNGSMNNLMVKNTNENTPHDLSNAAIDLLQKQKNLLHSCTITEVEPIEWPYGTLLRYSMFLQEEDKMKDYDYVFYMDIDMRIVNVVGDEILGKGLTIAPHPGYYLRKELYPPYEPNDQSASFIKRPGKVVQMDGKPRFMPFYAAGGFQGGTKESYIKAMKETKKLIDTDLNKNNYIPIWNDETAWNKYVFDCQTKEEIQDTIFLTPSYIYPDSLINEYYVKFWGQNFPPKIVTLTKAFTTQKIDMSKFTTM